MSRDLSLLLPEFRNKVEYVLSSLEGHEYDIIPFFTMRDVFEQAKLWRQSRTTAEIKSAVSRLKEDSAPFLAHVLESVGPQYGRWATNALPGQSWHQFGEAIDCFVRDRRTWKAVWTSGHPGYLSYAEKARSVGLTAGHFWNKKDSVHVQLRSGSVQRHFCWEEINQKMESLYGKHKIIS